MSQSRLQEPYMEEIAANFAATRSRLLRRLAANPDSVVDIVEDELRGLYHGLFVVLDGGTALADEGLVYLVDDRGQQFDRFLHEICFGYWHEDATGGASPDPPRATGRDEE